MTFELKYELNYDINSNTFKICLFQPRCFISGSYTLLPARSGSVVIRTQKHIRGLLQLMNLFMSTNSKYVYNHHLLQNYHTTNQNYV